MLSIKTGYFSMNIIVNNFKNKRKCYSNVEVFKGLFTRSNFDLINIENLCLRDGICWCSHDPVFASNYFVTSSKNFNNSCFENFMPSSPQLDPAVAAIL